MKKKKSEIGKLREIVWARCGGYCEKCGNPLEADNWALHHRKLKSRGGEDSPANCVALHHWCHNLGTDSVHSRVTEATRRGLIVNSWDNPDITPVTLCTGEQVLLTEHYEKAGNTWQQQSPW